MKIIEWIIFGHHKELIPQPVPVTALCHSSDAVVLPVLFWMHLVQYSLCVNKLLSRVTFLGKPYFKNIEQQLKFEELLHPEAFGEREKTALLHGFL